MDKKYAKEKNCFCFLTQRRKVPIFEGLYFDLKAIIQNYKYPIYDVNVKEILCSNIWDLVTWKYAFRHKMLVKSLQ